MLKNAISHIFQRGWLIPNTPFWVAKNNFYDTIQTRFF